MLRSIAAVVLSYIAMALIVVAAFAGLLLGLGFDRLFEPGSWKGNLFFCIAVPTITAIAGLFGGWMCTKIGRGKGPAMALSALVMVVGMIMAYITMQKPEPTGPRDPNMSIKEFKDKGREPTWVAISNPIIGAFTVLLAARFTTSRRRP